MAPEEKLDVEAPPQAAAMSDVELRNGRDSSAIFPPNRFDLNTVRYWLYSVISLYLHTAHRAKQYSLALQVCISRIMRGVCCDISGAAGRSLLFL